MSAPFAPGDVVVVVPRPVRGASPNVRYIQSPRSRLKVGSYHRIQGVFRCFDVWAVRLCGVEPSPGSKGFPADRFRKIDDEVTDEFKAHLRELIAPAKQREGV